MPVNAPIEYFKAEQKFQLAKTTEEKIAALEEMIRLLPKHHGSEAYHAQLRSRLAKLRREAVAEKKRGGRRIGITKEGEAQVCLVGKTMSGKSLLLSKLTGAKPELADHPYTTMKPEVGMMDWRGVRIQLVEIPATFEPSSISICRTADLVAVVAKDEASISEIEGMLKDNFVRTRMIRINPVTDIPEIIRERIASALGLIIVYTRRPGKLSPMALKAGATIRDFASRIHKDFIKNFRFAFLWRIMAGQKRKMQVGLDYTLQDGDVVEIHTG